MPHFGSCPKHLGCNVHFWGPFRSLSKPETSDGLSKACTIHSSSLVESDHVSLAASRVFHTRAVIPSLPPPQPPERFSSGTRRRYPASLDWLIASGPARSHSLFRMVAACRRNRKCRVGRQRPARDSHAAADSMHAIAFDLTSPSSSHAMFGRSSAQRKSSICGSGLIAVFSSSHDSVRTASWIPTRWPESPIHSLLKREHLSSPQSVSLFMPQSTVPSGSQRP